MPTLRLRARALVLLASGLAASVVGAAEPAGQHAVAAGADARATGNGTLVQRGGRFQLSATLSEGTRAPAMAAAALEGGSYTLNAVASASSLVCYNDTIFRDDFDGDGF